MRKESQPKEHFLNSEASFDVERYDSYLDGMNLTDQQREDLLRALFDIMKRCVDLGFDVSALPLDYNKTQNIRVLQSIEHSNPDADMV